MFSFLYRYLFKPLAFSQDPEKVHDRITVLGNVLGKFAFTRNLSHSLFAYEHSALSRTVAGITFKNPIGLSAGFDKNGNLIDILPYVGFGFAEIGSVTAKPCTGNPKPRLWRLPESQALVVNYGLMNDGVDVVLERIGKSRVVKYKHTPAPGRPPDARRSVTPSQEGNSENPLQWRGGSEADGVGDSVLENFRIGISVAKTNCKETAEEETGIADYFECFQKVNASGLADYITINISCPNAYGGEPFTVPEKFERLSVRLKEVPWSVPVFVKLPCDYTVADLRGSNADQRGYGVGAQDFVPPQGWAQTMEDFEGMLEVAVKYGYSGVILSNLTKERVNNHVLQKSDLSKVGKGGISGKPTFERSNALIRNAREYLGSFSSVGAGLAPAQVGAQHFVPLRAEVNPAPTTITCRNNNFAIIGCGGVFSGEDAKAKVDAGADLVQLITGMIYEGPQLVGEINKYLVQSTDC